MFAYIRTRFHFPLIGGIWEHSRRGATRELEAEFKSQRRSCKLSFLSGPAARAPLRAFSQAYPLNKQTNKNIIFDHNV